MKSKVYKQQEEENVQIVSEPATAYVYNMEATTAKPFAAKIMALWPYKKLELLSKNTPFDMQMWAGFIHVSERTLHRYAKDNKSFDALQSERITQLELLFAKGESVFGSKQIFCDWLLSKPFCLNGIIEPSWLGSFYGTQYILQQLGRLEHGIFA